MATFLDTNVLIDVLSEDLVRSTASAQKLNEAKARGRVLITDIVYAELSIDFESVEAVDEVIRSMDVTRVPCSTRALFRAGRAFESYKNQNAGPKDNVLPDFLIGAHAAVEGMPLVTSDTRRMTGYFPELQVVKP